MPERRPVAPAPPCITPLREWLLNEAYMSLQHVDKILANLQRADVCTVDALRRLHCDVGLRDVLRDVTAAKIAVALDAKPLATPGSSTRLGMVAALPSGAWTHAASVYEYSRPGNTPRPEQQTASRTRYTMAVASDRPTSPTAAMVRLQASERRELSIYRACGIIIRERQTSPPTTKRRGLSPATAVARLQAAARRRLHSKSVAALKIETDARRRLARRIAASQRRQAAAAARLHIAGMRRSERAAKALQAAARQWMSARQRQVVRIPVPEPEPEDPAIPESYRQLWQEEVTAEDRKAALELEMLKKRVRDARVKPRGDPGRFMPRMSVMTR